MPGTFLRAGDLNWCGLPAIARRAGCSRRCGSASMLRAGRVQGQVAWGVRLPAGIASLILVLAPPTFSPSCGLASTPPHPPLLQVQITGPAANVMTVRVAVTQKLRERIPAIAAVQLVN